MKLSIITINNFNSILIIRVAFYWKTLELLLQQQRNRNKKKMFLVRLIHISFCFKSLGKNPNITAGINLRVISFFIYTFFPLNISHTLILRLNAILFIADVFIIIISCKFMKMIKYQNMKISFVYGKCKKKVEDQFQLLFNIQKVIKDIRKYKTAKFFAIF